MLSQTINTKDLRDFDSLPGPKLWPLLGNLEHLKKGITMTHEVQLEMVRKYGPVCKDSQGRIQTFATFALANVRFPHVFL